MKNVPVPEVSELCGEFRDRSISSSDVRSFYYEPSSVANCHGSAMSAFMIRCRKLYYKEKWMDIVFAYEHRVNRGRATGCRRCYTSRTTEVNGQPPQRRHLSEYPSDAWASRELVHLNLECTCSFPNSSVIFLPLFQLHLFTVFLVSSTALLCHRM